jgi:hypothetical protein
MECKHKRGNQGVARVMLTPEPLGVTLHGLFLCPRNIRFGRYNPTYNRGRSKVRSWRRRGKQSPEFLKLMAELSLEARLLPYLTWPSHTLPPLLSTCVQSTRAEPQTDGAMRRTHPSVPLPNTRARATGGFSPEPPIPYWLSQQHADPFHKVILADVQPQALMS